jgi:hypothetical protein
MEKETKYYQVRLVRLKSNHQNLRTSKIKGVTQRLPIIGEPFILFAPPLEEGNLRIIGTTEVQSIKTAHEEGVDVHYFTTVNSDYKVEILAWPTALC